jgi:hypothetical protein
VPAAPRREASRVLGFDFRANASLGEEKCREATPKNPAGKLWCSGVEGVRGSGLETKNLDVLHANMCALKKR